MAGRSITLKALRAREEAQVPLRLGVRVVAVFVVLQLLLLLLLSLLLLFPSMARAAPVKGEVAVTTKEGYARLVFTLAEEADAEAEVRLNNGILIIAFKQAVDVSTERLPLPAPGYVGAARRGGQTRAHPQAPRQFEGRGRKGVRRAGDGRLDRLAARPAAGRRRGAR